MMKKTMDATLANWSPGVAVELHADGTQTPAPGVYAPTVVMYDPATDATEPILGWDVIGGFRSVPEFPEWSNNLLDPGVYTIARVETVKAVKAAHWALLKRQFTPSETAQRFVSDWTGDANPRPEAREALDLLTTVVAEREGYVIHEPRWNHPTYHYTGRDVLADDRAATIDVLAEWSYRLAAWVADDIGGDLVDVLATLTAQRNKATGRSSGSRS